MPVWGRGPVPAFLLPMSLTRTPLCHLSRHRWDARSFPLRGLLDAAGALQTRGVYARTGTQTVGVFATIRLRLPKSLFGSLSGARLRANRIFLSPPFVLPRLAGGGGKRRKNCLRAKPEFFCVPPSARSKGSPQGQDWLGCHFLVSSFGHAKEER